MSTNVSALNAFLRICVIVVAVVVLVLVVVVLVSAVA